MIISDNVIERNKIYLENINSSDLGQDVWSSATGNYDVYIYFYSKPLSFYRTYFFGCTYRYTTTNQKPSWANMYTRSGMEGIGGSAFISYPQPNIEYQLKGLKTLNLYPFSNTFGALYNGPSNAINGVLAQTKNVFAYDVTELYVALQSKGVDPDSWIKANVGYHPYNQTFAVDLSSIGNSTNNTIQMKKGTVLADEIVEPDGMIYYSSVVKQSYKFSNTWFDDGLSGIYGYNNEGNGTVTYSIVSADSVNSPFRNKHKSVLKIEKISGSSSPGLGGFYIPHNAYANAVFVEKFVAKIPVGYCVGIHYNEQGNNHSINFIGSNLGTGDWKEYTILYKCGATGSFSTGGHVAIHKLDNNQPDTAIWYVAYVNNCDITSNPNLAHYSVLETAIKNGILSSLEVTNNNLIKNGDLKFTETIYVPSGYTIDKTDKAGDGYACYNQAVGANGRYVLFPEPLPINPSGKYRLSYWVKCKRDMSSFLTAIIPYTTINGELILLQHTLIHYHNSAKTTLTQDLNAGDTQVHIANTNGWANRSYAHLAFRKDYYNSSWNDFAMQDWTQDWTDGYISSVESSGIVNLKYPFTGAIDYWGDHYTTIPSGQCVVLAYDGGTYPYPIQKGNLPTNNEWTFVSATFGSTSPWDGNNYNSSCWLGLPPVITHFNIILNLYTNDGSVPIKYSDIKLEKIEGFGDGNKNETIYFRR